MFNNYFEVFSYSSTEKNKAKLGLLLKSAFSLNTANTAGNVNMSDNCRINAYSKVNLQREKKGTLADEMRLPSISFRHRTTTHFGAISMEKQSVKIA